jgi:hypothetical protein
MAIFKYHIYIISVFEQKNQQPGAAVVHKGPMDVIKFLYKEGGISSIFRGTGATLLRDGPGSAAYFVAYEVVKKSLIPQGKTAADLNPLSVLFAGGTCLLFFILSFLYFNFFFFFCLLLLFVGLFTLCLNK